MLRLEGGRGVVLSSLGQDDPVAPKAPLQLQVLQLLPQLLPLLLLLLLTEMRDIDERLATTYGLITVTDWFTDSTTPQEDAAHRWRSDL